MIERRARRVGRRALGSLTIVALALAASSCDQTRDAASNELDTAVDGTLTVAAALPSPGFWDGVSVGELEGGFEYVLAERLAERFGLDLAIVDVPFDRIAAGDLGGADLALAQIEYTDARAEVMQLTTSYYTTDVGVLARDGDEIDDLATAKERRFAVVEASREEEIAHQLLHDDQIVAVPLEVDAAAAIEAGDVDAALVDLPTSLILSGREPGLATVSKLLTGGRYVAALPSEAPRRNVELVDAALRAFDADGTLDELEAEFLLPLYSTAPDDLPVLRARIEGT